MYEYNVALIENLVIPNHHSHYASRISVQKRGNVKNHPKMNRYLLKSNLTFQKT